MAEDTKLRFSRANPPYTSSAAAAAARSANSDPLVELARLIGREDAVDPERHPAGTFSRPSAATTSELPASERLEAATRELSRSLGLRDPRMYRPPEPGLARAFAQTEPASPPTARPPAPEKVAEPSRDVYAAHASVHADDESHEAETRAYEAPHYEANAAEPYDAAEPDPAYDYADENIGPLPSERRRGGMMTIAAVLGLAVIGTAGAVGYRAYMAEHSGPPPVIKADSSPAKIVPPQPKTETANRVAYNRPDKNPIERILSREEQPIEMKEAKTVTPRMVAPSAGAGSLSGPAAQAGGPITGSTPAQTGPNEPKKVKTVAVRPDGTIVPDSARAAVEPDPRIVTGGQAAPRVPVARPGTSGSAAPTRSAPAQTASLAPAVTVPNGSHVVQLTSQKSEAEAEASFRALQTRYPNVLGGWQPLIRRVDLGARGTYYRAQVGPFASIEEANEFCGNLKAAGGQCIVQRN